MDDPSVDTNKHSASNRSRTSRNLSKHHLSALIALLLIWSVGFIYLRTQVNNYRSSLDESRSALLRSADTISALPSPSKIEKGQPDSSLSVILKRTQDAQQLTDIPFPNETLLLLLKLQDGKWRKDVHQRDNLKQLARSRDDTLKHHYATLEVLRPTLTYNPISDLSNEQLSNEQLDERIELAAEGLVLVRNDLAKINFEDDSTVKDLEDVIAKLQADLRQFKSTKDKGAWYKAVASAQDQIIANRATFWSQASDKLLADHATVIQSVSSLINKL